MLDHYQGIIGIVELFELLVYYRHSLKIVRLGNGVSSLIITDDDRPITLPEIDPTSLFSEILNGDDDITLDTIILPHYKDDGERELIVTNRRIYYPAHPGCFVILSHRHRFPGHPTLLFYYGHFLYYKIVFIPRWGMTHVKYKRYFNGPPIGKISFFDFGTDDGTIRVTYQDDDSEKWRDNLITVTHLFDWMKLLIINPRFGGKVPEWFLPE